MADYREMARQAAIAAGIDAPTFLRQINAESGFNPKAGSSAGAQGIAQIMPATAKGWGVDPWNPQAALNAAARNMAKYINSYGGWKNALVAYNAGPGRVGKPLYSETANYINKILGEGGEPPRGTPQRAAGAQAGMGMPAQDAGADRRARKLEFIFAGSPLAGIATRRSANRLEQPAAPVAGNPAAAPRGGGGPASGGNWREIQQIGNQIGLKNDPGIGQLYGGKHSDNSEHYGDGGDPEEFGRAVDWGTALNPTPLLKRAMAIYRKRGYDTLWEGDHLHVSQPGSGI